VSGLGQRVPAPRSWPWREARGLLAAVCFLTRLPLGRWVELDGSDVARAGVAFPLLGAALGAAVGSLAAALAGRLSPLLAVAIALAAGTALTGALHLDALADAADALGAHSRERALEIMRDSRIGAFGAVAIVLDLLLKVAALEALVNHQRVVRYAVVAFALARVLPVLLAAWLPYARPDGGAGTALTRGGRARALLAAAVALGLGLAVAGWRGVALWGAVMALATLLVPVVRRLLGGVTGDVLGAAVELCETLVLVLAVALVGGR
jgi:adenosylcobinamide-GDP ribazoletransferase